MNLQLNLSPHFWIGLVIFIAQGIGQGAIHLTNIVPAEAIPYVTAWAGLLSFVGTGYLVGALGLQQPQGEKK